MTEPLPYAPPPPPEPKRPLRRTPLWAAGLFVLVVIDWFAWLGWDTEYDTAPDGSESGPYQTWQVAGMVLVLLAAVVFVLSTRRALTVIVVPLALTLSAALDWSMTDSSGLWVVGAGLMFLGSALGCAAMAAVVVPIAVFWRAMRRRRSLHARG